MNLLRLFENSDNLQAFPAGETIFAAGSTGELMYVLTSGEVELQLDGNVIDTLEPGSILGEMALIDSQVRSTTAIAKSDCQLAPVDEKRFLFMVEQTPFFALHVMRVLAERLRHMNSL